AIREEQVSEALKAAEADAHAFEEKAKSIEKELDELSHLLSVGAGQANSFHRAVETLADHVRTALADAPTSGGNTPSDVRDAVASLSRTADMLKQDAEQLQNSFLAGRRDFTARRYEHEARDNEQTANVLEIQVRKSSWESERHRRRSQLFFIGMLV